MITWWALLIMIVASFISAFAGLILKKSTDKLRVRKYQYLLVLGLGLYGLSAILTIIAYTGGSLIVIFPLTSLPYVWTMFIAKKHLGEEINKYKISGLTLIIVGIITIII